MASEEKNTDNLTVELEQLISPEELGELEKWAKADAEYEAKRDVGWLTVKEASEELGVSVSFLTSSVKRYESQENASSDSEISYSHAFKIEYSKVYPKLFNPEFLEQIVEEENAIKKSKEKKPHHLGKIETASELATSCNSSRFFEVWRRILAGEEIYGKVIRFEKVISGKKPVDCIHRSDLPFLTKTLGLESKPDNDHYFTKTSLLKQKNQTPGSREAMNRLEAAFLERRFEFSDARNLSLSSFEIDGYKIEMKVYRDKKQPSVYYHKNSRKDLISYAKLPPDTKDKTKDWLTRKELEELLGGRQTKKTDPFFKEAQDKYIAAEKSDSSSYPGYLVISGTRIRIERRSQGKAGKPICYHKDEVDRIKEIIGFVKLKTDQHLTQRELGIMLGINPSVHKKYKALWVKIRENYEQGKPTSIGGEDVNFESLRNSANTGLYVKRTYASLFASEVLVSKNRANENSESEAEYNRKRHNGWLTISEASEVVSNVGRKKLTKDVKEVLEDDKFHEIEGVKYKGSSLVYQDPSKSKRSILINPILVEHYNGQYPDLRKKTPEWLDRAEASEVIEIHAYNERFDKLWKELVTKGEIAGQKVQSGFKISGLNKPFCIHISAVDLFREKMAELKAASQVKPNGKVQKDSIAVEAIEESRGKQNGK